MIKDLITNILGSYEPIMTDVYTSGETPELVGSIVASGAAGVDWVYIGALAMLAITTYCIFRIIGSVISNV